MKKYITPAFGLLTLVIMSYFLKSDIQDLTLILLITIYIKVWSDEK